MKDDFDFHPLISAKLLQVNATKNPTGILEGTCSYDVKMVWDNGILLSLRTDNESAVKRLEKAIGHKLDRYEEPIPNHATMKVEWFFEKDYYCYFNVMGPIQWS